VTYVNLSGRKNIKMMNALSIDLEHWHSNEFIKNYLPADTEDQIIDSVSPLLSLLDKYDTCATFFVLGTVAESHPGLVREIHEMGHEIASHMYSHRMIHELDENEFADEIKKSINLLESITGEKPLGFRAPNFSIDNSSRWALKIIKEKRLSYDSSIFPVKTMLYGVPNAPSHPYKPSMDDLSMEDPAGELIEFPISVLRSIRNIPVGGGFYLRTLPFWFLKYAIGKINKKNPAMIYIHPWETYKKTPRIRAPLFSRFPHGEIVGISPAFSVKTLLGKAIVSMPFFEYGGPCVRKGFEGFIYAISKYYKDKVEDDGIDYVELRISPGEKNEDLMKNGFSRQLKAYGFHINVKDMDFEKDIWRGLYTKKSRVRNSVRKAKKKGVRVKEDDDMGAYYRLYLKTMSKLGTPPHPRELFDNINKHIAPYSRFTFAYLSKKPIAAMMSLCYNKRDLMVGLVSDPAYYDLHANDLLYNEQIEYATKNGFEVVDFGRTRPNSTYERYKRKWGAIQTEMYSYVYPKTAAERINPYKNYLRFSGLTKRIPWIFTKTRIGPHLAERFP